MDDLLIALDRINKSGLDVKLNLITKKEELVHIKNSSLLDSDWIEVMEASGEALEPIYAKCDLGILPKKDILYGYGNIGKGSRVHEPRTTHDIH